MQHFKCSRRRLMADFFLWRHSLWTHSDVLLQKFFLYALFKEYEGDNYKKSSIFVIGNLSCFFKLLNHDSDFFRFRSRIQIYFSLNMNFQFIQIYILLDCHALMNILKKKLLFNIAFVNNAKNMCYVSNTFRSLSVISHLILEALTAIFKRRK